MEPTLALIHPGEILREEFLKPMGLTQVRLAHDLGIPLRKLQELLQGRRGITAEMALRLSLYFGTSAELWMNLQSDYELRRARRERFALVEQQVQRPAA